MSPVPRLLVSVRNVTEADAALRGGADVIDVKEPDAGPLGMAGLSTIRAIIEHIAAARPVTAALGELHEHMPPAPPKPQGESASLGDLPPKLHYIKLGLAHAPADWPTVLNAHLRHHRPERFIAVAYADHARIAAPPIDDVLAWTIERRAAGLLIDTAVKDGRSLRDWCDPPTLQHLIHTAHAHQLVLALAGSLDVDAIERLAPLGPDLIAVRGAACERNDRAATVSAARVRRLKTLLSAHSAATHHPTSATGAPSGPRAD